MDILFAAQVLADVERYEGSLGLSAPCGDCVVLFRSTWQDQPRHRFKRWPVPGEFKAIADEPQEYGDIILYESRKRLLWHNHYTTDANLPEEQGLVLALHLILPIVNEAYERFRTAAATHEPPLKTFFLNASGSFDLQPRCEEAMVELWRAARVTPQLAASQSLH